MNPSDIWPLIRSQTFFSEWTSCRTRNETIRQSAVCGFHLLCFQLRFSTRPNALISFLRDCHVWAGVSTHFLSSSHFRDVSVSASLTLHMAGHSHAPHRRAITDALSLVFFRLIKSFDTLFAPRDLFIYYESCRHRRAGKFGSHRTAVPLAAEKRPIFGRQLFSPQFVSLLFLGDEQRD